MCKSVGYSRAGYYKRARVEIRRRREEAVVLSLVINCKYRQPVVGVRKMQKMLLNKGLRVGRDRLFSLLRREGLLVRRKRRYVRTTNSHHRFRVHKNLIKELELRRPNHVYVADITYLKISGGFSYLSLITDKYSRKIVGYELSRSLALEGTLKALEMATGAMQATGEIIHHSDRGLQYCSNVYTNKLKKHGIKISMTEENHVYENALAERVNGILKNELLLGSEHLPFREAKKLVDEAVKIYNYERLHLSLNYKTPAVVHAA